ncbi:MAG: hypothetical protein KDA28_00660 [Phycisphaerales bacterium]|nr:hypothetical protein [Phycisphaerales bacterium]
MRQLMLCLCLSLTLAGCAKEKKITHARAAGNEAWGDGNYEAALVEYQTVVDLKPHDIVAHQRVGNTLMKLNRPEEARTHYEIIFDKDPENLEYLESLCQSMLQSGAHDELQLLLRERCEQYGTVEDYMRRGFYAFRVGDIDDAEQSLITAAQLDGGQTVGPQLALAEFYREVGDEKNEVYRLRCVLGIDDQDPDATERLRELKLIPGPSFAIVPPESGG